MVFHDLYHLTELPKVGSDDVLIGYSMGGRIAMEIAQKHQFRIKKLILISAHPGLETGEERRARKNFEKMILEKLIHLDREAFLEYWNELPLFIHDRPLELISDERFKASAALFSRYLLSEQPHYLPDLAQHRDQVLYIVGLFDERYMELVTEELMPSEITIRGIPAGHRLFQQKDELLQILTSEGIL